MQIKPSKEVLHSWIDSYVPKKDLFFLSKENLNHEMDLTNVLLMPIDEFENHSTYKQLNYVNSYEYWNIKNEEYVIIAEKDWIESIPTKTRQLILNSQIQHERGLVIPASFIDNIENIPSDYVMNNHVVIQRAMWERLSVECKEQLLTTMVYEWWDKGECEESPLDLDDFLKPFVNTFSDVQGANCLAAVLFAISNGEQEWFIYEWIHQKTFLEKLKQYDYEESSSEELKKGDVVVWLDVNDIIQHAAYYIGDNCFFNKHGQTIFNPWKILSKELLFKEWSHFRYSTYSSRNRK
ncbi:hypothetical protein [Solibacillus sp. CAU 1738]|uniref:hypothetical protein n=1 Tax=Solibacillus sp. CAU 1738 TaxID=3140363 RepID=UPI003260AC11